jgi:hypothetical protein
MTKQEAKELCLEVWGYLRDHPDVEYKENLPQELYNCIRRLESSCPLCEVVRPSCNGCPLSDAGETCVGGGSVYHRWKYSIIGPDGEVVRREAAGRIYDIVKAWEV